MSVSLILTTGYHWSVARCKFATGAIFAIHWDAAAASTGIPRHVAARALVHYRSNLKPIIGLTVTRVKFCGYISTWVGLFK